MDPYLRKQRWKIYLGLMAVVIAASTLAYTGYIIRRLSLDEQNKVRLWAEAVKRRANLIEVTRQLFEWIEEDERNKAQIIAEATRMLLESESQDLSFYSRILESNTTIPIIVTYDDGRIMTVRNLEEDSLQALERIRKVRSAIPLVTRIGNQTFRFFLYYDDSRIYRRLRSVMNDLVNAFISETVSNAASVPVVYTDQSQKRVLAHGNIPPQKLAQFRSDAELIDYVAGDNEPIEVQVARGEKNYIFYRDSNLLTTFRYFPYAQLTVFALFVLVAYLMFSTARRSDENLVWVGMSKETAHQLGTPLSSLMGWIEILRLDEKYAHVAMEMEKDIQRLNVVAERFSKIGSQPELSPQPIVEVVRHMVDYFRQRLPSSVQLEVQVRMPLMETVNMNRPLVEWVIENLTRNAIDAMPRGGTITYHLADDERYVYLDVSDTGKGIPKKFWKKIFYPGFTTRKRGWGLGLSLTRRIVEQYHKGRVYVLKSEPGKGTTMRVVLRKN
ncbi:MAG: HAMP domain-containing histidine kinase [Flavobacteriales bacterium]|nr:HAMP domain-containing histidine kinase [Flavobacteriales bacterium]MDW8410650.1 HAMP domain-containing sensor histidine kinase [Flavobacteriales bacterium]